jgi:hypothetical protein
MVIHILYLRNDIFDLSPEYTWMSTLQRPYIELVNEDSTLLTFPKNKSFPLDTATLRHRLKKKPIRLSDFSLYNRIQLLSASSDSSTKSPPEIELCSPQRFSRLSKEMDKLRWILTNAAEQCSERNIPYVVVLAPSFVQVNTDSFKTMLKPYKSEQESLISTYPNQQIMNWEAELMNVYFIDLLPHFHKEQKPYSTWYFPRNQHWNERGHAFVADILAHEIEKRGFLND